MHNDPHGEYEKSKENFIYQGPIVSGFFIAPYRASWPLPRTRRAKEQDSLGI